MQEMALPGARAVKVVTYDEIDLSDWTESRLKRDLEEVTKQIRKVYCVFNNQIDQDMIDSCIYEMLSLEARQKYLIKQLKIMKLEN